MGIDGYSNTTVEQIGTEQDSISGVARYYAWYEMYPKASVQISSVPIYPNDVVTAEVTYIGSKKFALSISNQTHPASFSITQRGNGKRSSAEWIEEAPSSGSTLPLANFGTVNFSNCTFNNGVHIDASGWQYDKIDMVNASGQFLARPSALTNGTGFSVTWYQAN